MLFALKENSGKVVIFLPTCLFPILFVVPLFVFIPVIYSTSMSSHETIAKFFSFWRHSKVLIEIVRAYFRAKFDRAKFNSVF